MIERSSRVGAGIEWVQSTDINMTNMTYEMEGEI